MLVGAYKRGKNGIYDFLLLQDRKSLATLNTFVLKSLHVFTFRCLQTTPAINSCSSLLGHMTKLPLSPTAKNAIDVGKKCV